MPAGTIEAGEEPADAAVRETLEETGLAARVIRELGSATYDLSPTRDEIARRTFFQLELNEKAPERWTAGEMSPSTAGSVESWECWWMPLTQAHVLAAGLGALIGEIVIIVAWGPSTAQWIGKRQPRSVRPGED